MCRLLNYTITAGLAVALIVTLGSGVQAQAWLPQKGEAAISLYYNYIDVGNHLFSKDVIDGEVNYGKSLDFGDIKAHSVHLNIEYGITNRLAIAAVFPAGIVSRYDGEIPDNPMVDDGVYRGGFQDFGLQARYMAVSDPVVLTPFISVAIPSHSYETLGHTAIGRDLTELHLGLYAGRLLDFVSDNLYAQAGYDFAYAEEHMGIRTNRSNVNFTLGYFLTPAVSLNSTLYYQKTYNGLDWVDDTSTEEGFHNHDRHSADNHLNLDGTLTVSPSDALSFFVSYTDTMWGENTHEIQSVSLGSTWSLWIGQ